MTVAAISFQLVVGGRSAAGYSMRATAAGRSAEATLALPPLPDDRDALGLALGHALFPPPIRQLLLDVARGADAAGARVQLQLQLVAPELQALPWEWATLGSETPWRPALREDYTLLRVVASPRPQPALAVRGPLRLLIACAPGATAAAAPLGHALAEPVRAGLLVVDLLRDADPLTLREALAEEPCHALHLVADDASGHESAARLRLGRGLDAAGLAGILEDYPDLRLVALAAPNGDTEAVAAVAAELHQRLGVAAIALGALDNAGAAAFCGPCYGALALGDPADLAVTDGRAALAEAGMAWGVPRAWLAPGGEPLFDPRPGPPLAAPSYSRAASERAPGAASLPVGTPLRPSRAAAAPGRATKALAAARSFVVEATTVGEPAQRQRPEAGGRGLRQPKLIALAVACVLLALLVSRVLPADAPANAEPASVTPSSLPTLSPTGAAGAAEASLVLPASIPQPKAFTSYVVAEGDTPERIAERAGSEPAALLALNGLAPAAPLRPGRPLVVPLYREGEALMLAPIINRGNPNNPLVALTFDIELDDVTLYSILEIMAEKGVKGTFFVTGSWVQRYPEAAKAIVAAGQEVANHSLSHPAFSSIGADSALNELSETERIVGEVMGVSARPYFRFPYGDSTPAMVELVGRAGYVAYHWSADDFAIPSWLAQATANPTQAYGGILLMHGRPTTVDSLGGYIDQLKAMGLTPTTLGEVLR